MKRASAYFADALAKMVRFASAQNRAEGRIDRDIDIALARLTPDLSGVSDAVAYVQFLRSCIEPMRRDVVTVKTGPHDDLQGRRFQTLVDCIRSNVPPVPTPLALEIALVADALRGTTTPLDFEYWAGDVGHHFAISSSKGGTGRLLSSIVRFCRPAECLELGTAYGMSTRFILGTKPCLHLTTIEGHQPTHARTSSELTARYGSAVDCRLGFTADVLPELAPSIAPIDFMFHDAAHTEQDYIRDFSLIVDSLAPGAVILIDDIRWEDPRFHKGPANTYRGWQAIAGHGRVRHAVEVDESIGMALLR